MIRILMSVLLFSALVYAQPVRGPFVLAQHNGNPGLDNPQLSLRSDSAADIFFQIGDSVFHSMARIPDGEMIGIPQLFPACDSGYSQQLHNVVRIDSGWGALSYQLSTSHNKTVVYSGHDEIDSAVAIDSGRNWASQVAPSSWNEETVITPKAGGGYYTSWISHVLSYIDSFWCEEIALRIKQYSNGNPAHEQSTCTPQTVSNCLLRSITPDSTIALIWREGFPFELCRITEPWDWSSVWHLTFDCTGKPVDFLATHAGRFFVLSKTLDYPGVHNNPRLLELMESSTYEERLPLTSDPIASSSHPDFGIAWLSQPGGGLLLTRVDTTGTVIHPESAFYWPEATQQIVSAKVSISETGQVVVIWCERQIADTANSSLKIASVDWNTPLEANDSRSILQPSIFNLSAFPNPFNSEVRISYNLPRAQTIKLAVFNVLGQKVATLFEGNRSAGTYSFAWKPDLGTGVYFVTLISGDYVKTEKVLYLR